MYIYISCLNETSIFKMVNEDKINCRLCDKDITGKNGLLLFDYDENIETLLGRKINTILNSADEYEVLSNYCCEYCASKIEICFNLLLEIKASDEVIRQTYRQLSNRKDVDTSIQIFTCQECNANITGMKFFIKHHENHILNRTTVGSKKDITLSSVLSVKQKQCSDDSIDNIVCSNNESIVLEDDNGVNYENENGDEGEDEDTDDYYDFHNDYNCEINEDYDISSSDLNDDEFHELYNWETILNDSELLENYESNSENEENSENFLESLKDSELLFQDSDDSDSKSDISTASDSSLRDLVSLVKLELEKSEEEENEEINSLQIDPNNDGKYNCEVCNITFDYKFLLILHLKTDHKDYHEFDTTASLNESESLDNEILKLESSERGSYNSITLCQICGKMCNLQHLEKHMKEHKKQDGWACELCGKTFKAKRFLKSHLGEHDESKKKICEICGKKLLPLSFFSHISKHRDKRHICQYCGKGFTYNYGLRIHLKVHDVNKKLESKADRKKGKVFCWLCKKDFNCTIALNKHLKNDHQAEGVEQDSRFPCSQCDKKFADMFSLKAHLKLIHELKDEEIAPLKSLPVYRYIECNVCNKVFNSENKIRIHMKQDHGLKPFEMEILKKECEKCGKKFSSKQNLIHHINSAHLHIKPMTCDICQEKFAKHSSLIYHKLRHSGEKPFQCEFCHKSYRQRNDVIRHLARHVRDKELTLEEASAVNNSPSRLVIKRRIFLKDSSINYRTIVRKNRRKSEVIEMEPILEEEVNEIQEEQMEFCEEGLSDMIYVEEVQVDENEPGSPVEVHCKPVYNEETNTIILSNPDIVKNSVKNINCKYIPSQLKHVPAVIVKKQEQI